MARRTFADRMAELDQPDLRTDEEEIWGVLRAALSVGRVVVFLGIILVSEFLEEYFYNGLSIAIWSLICLLYTSPSPRDGLLSRMPSSA